jgi:excisionase family DNA binding protein
MFGRYWLYMNSIEELRSRPGLISALAASKLVGRSKKTLTKWINAGTFQVYRVGNANKIDRSYLADWLEKRALTKG